MKRIMAFGDSNTWGWNPAASLGGPAVRYEETTRWTGRLQSLLGDSYKIIEEGLNGRTTVFQDPLEPYRCGKDTLVPLLLTHKPLDLVIIMLGTNDLKTRFAVPPADINLGVHTLIQMCRNYPEAFSDGNPSILLMAPAPLNIEEGTEAEEGFEGGNEKSRRLGGLYKQTASTLGVDFIDLGNWISAGRPDGIHLSADSHRIIAEKVSEKIREILP